MADAASRSNVLKANDAFYDAVRAGDFARLDNLWSREREVAVFHPGWAGVSGRDEVMASWAEIFVAGNAPDIWPVDEHIFMTNSTALVYCTEVIGTDRLTATNVFVREAGGWRISQHMAYG